MDDPLVCPPGGNAFGRLAGMGCADRFWVSAEYLLWWTRTAQVPTLVATGPGTIVDPTTGAFMVPITQPVVGGSFGQTQHSGFRVGAGWWFSDSQCRGIDARFFFLSPNGTTFATDSNQFPVLARPFVNVNPATGALPADVIAAPMLASGAVAVNLQNSLWGAEVNYRRNLLCSPCARLDALVGYRFLNFKESLSISEGAIITPGGLLTGVVPSTAAFATDQFRTDNSFHGGQIGLAGEIRRGRWSVDGRASIAFGTVFQTADIAGAQVQLLPTGVAVFPGGLLALPGANIGHFSQTKFAVVPEVGVNLGYYITPCCRVFVGYNFLYLSSVLRPGGVINQNVDAARIPNFPLPNGGAPLPGPGQPSPVLRTTDFFAQGISFGVQFRW
jgi:hypothetical protein